MKILLLTSIYPACDMPKGITPVVHYFAKEWVRMGNEVHVMHYATVFPQCYYIVSKLLADSVATKVGYVVSKEKPQPKEFELDGVYVNRLPLCKFIPHGHFSGKQIDLAVKKTIDYCGRKHFQPDVIIGHWTNPQAEIISKLKKVFHVPTTLVFHGNGVELKKLYPRQYEELLSDIDLFGFRCKANKEAFEKWYDKPLKKWFYCYSGIPEIFIENKIKRDFLYVRNYIYVGTLIKRKYPEKILPALLKNYPDKDFVMNYIGEGDERVVLSKEVEKHKLEECVYLRGRIPRGQIKEYLKKSDVFIMISRNEVYGLVYLEAMATGCIPVASRGEGFDGIIEDGENGFLCEAGNADELVKVIARIKKMPSSELQRISSNAILTATRLTDRQVAQDYLQNVELVIK